MVLRKIKSAPANLCEMSHNQKSKSITPKIPFLLFNKESIEEYSKKENNKNLFIKEKRFQLKEQKKSIELVSNIINEMILDDKNPQDEEYLIVNFLIPYIGNNIINKNFIKNIFDSLLTYLVKTFILYIFHMVQHDNTVEIENYLHLDYLINKILNKERSI